MSGNTSPSYRWQAESLHGHDVRVEAGLDGGHYHARLLVDGRLVDEATGVFRLRRLRSNFRAENGPHALSVRVRIGEGFFHAQDKCRMWCDAEVVPLTIMAAPWLALRPWWFRLAVVALCLSPVTYLATAADGVRPRWLFPLAMISSSLFWIIARVPSRR